MCESQFSHFFRESCELAGMITIKSELVVGVDLIY